MQMKSSKLANHQPSLANRLNLRDKVRSIVSIDELTLARGVHYPTNLRAKLDFALIPRNASSLVRPAIGQ